MGEPSDYRSLAPQEPPESEAVAGLSSTPEIPRSYATCLKLIDNAKKTVAIGMVVCGLGSVLCTRRDDYLRLTLRQESGMWAWGATVFGIGVLACIGAALVLVVEYLARPAPTRFALRLVSVRSLLILVVSVAIYLGMAFGYGVTQGIGAVVGTFLLLAALREHRVARAVLAVLAAIVLVLTLEGTRSAYQYARWHTDEIVAAGSELMEQCPRSGYYPCNLHPEFDASTFVFFGEQVQPNDPRVPQALRRLGARRIWVDDERVAVYVGINWFDFSCLPHPEIEFQISRLPHPESYPGEVWGTHGKSSTRLADRFWTNVY
jgi:hypothetical protein